MNKLEQDLIEAAIEWYGLPRPDTERKLRKAIEKLIDSLPKVIA
jgi:hypothetical protein